MYTHGLYGIEILKPHNMCCCVGIYNMGRTAVGIRICINMFIVKNDWIRVTYFYSCVQLHVAFAAKQVIQSRINCVLTGFIVIPYC